jgi:hypothetical protein
MKLAILVATLALSGCAGEHATLEEACQQQAHCAAMELDACLTWLAVQAPSDACLDALAGSCEDAVAKAWVEDCYEPCYTLGDVVCYSTEVRRVCLELNGALWWVNQTCAGLYPDTTCPDGSPWVCFTMPELEVSGCGCPPG